MTYFLDYTFQLQSVAQCYSDNRSVMLIAEAIFPLVCTTIPIKRYRIVVCFIWQMPFTIAEHSSVIESVSIIAAKFR